MEWLTEFLSQYPYLGVGIVFVLCGVGLPIPEEVVLVTAGYVCYSYEHVDYYPMALACVLAILLGDLIPFALGRTFGPRLLRLRLLRMVVNRRRLAMFDRWFSRKGDMVIIIARFIPGLRVVAFFTGGTMRMPWLRFLLLDGLGVLLVAPLFVYLGLHFGYVIDDAIAWVKTVEAGILYTALTAGAIGISWYWLRRRAQRRTRLLASTGEAFVEPSQVASPTAPPLAPEPPQTPSPGGSANPGQEAREDSTTS